MARILVEMNGVRVGRGEGPTLEGVDWTISESEHWGILGESGSGKSLLIDALARRTPLSGGTISYSLDAKSCPTPFPSPGTIATFSSEDCRRFLARHLGYTQARWESSAKAEAIPARSLLNAGSDSRVLETLRLSHVLDRPLISLSSGEFRKLVLARALLAASRLLVLEDPFSGLDQESEAEFRHLLESLCRQRSPGLVIVVSQPEHLLDGLNRLIMVQDYRIVLMGPRAVLTAERRGGRMPAAPAGHYQSPTATAGEPIIQMNEVSVRYGESRILGGIDWTVREGENWAIVGPNGAGKSTLLSLVTGDNPQAYANDIRLFGRQRGSGESIWDLKRQLGSVSPELQFCYPPEATALEVVCSGLFDSIGLYRKSTVDLEQKATEWLESLGTRRLAPRRFWSLSAAEQRLVLLARALVKEPRLLVLDEPCLGLDASHVALFLRQVENLCRNRRTTVLFVTHRLDELPTTISHILKLDRGRITSAGPIDRA